MPEDTSETTPPVEGSSLRQRAARAGVWIVAVKAVQRSLGLVRMVVLARLLSPAEFGVYGFASLAIAFLDMFTETGADISVIRRKETGRDYLDTVWTLQFLRSLGLFLALVAGAGLVGWFFKSPRSTDLLRLLAFSVLIRGCTSVGVVCLRKELKYKALFPFSFGNSVADLLVTAVLAWWLRSAWALVGGVLAGQLAGCIISYMIHPYRPRFRMHARYLKELYHFGRWIFSQSFLFYFLTEGDKIILGRLLGSLPLGLYQMAFRVSNMPTTEIMHVVSRITLPAYASLRESLPRLRSVYLDTIQMIALLSSPLAAGLVCVAPSLTHCILGAAWVPATRAIQVLALFGFIRSVSANSGSFFYTIGRPDIVTKLMLGKVVLMAVMIVPMTLLFGMMGTVATMTLNALAAKPVTDYLVIRGLKCSARDMVYPQV
ncbi:MAG: lipopolysaccharide biosynthesis protein, partial [Lentisphaerota bacterium]